MQISWSPLNIIPPKWSNKEGLHEFGPYKRKLVGDNNKICSHHTIWEYKHIFTPHIWSTNTKVEKMSFQVKLTCQEIKDKKWASIFLLLNNKKLKKKIIIFLNVKHPSYVFKVGDDEIPKKNAQYLYEDENDIIWCESVG